MIAHPIELIWEKMKQQNNIIVDKRGEVETIQPLGIEEKWFITKAPARYFKNKQMEEQK